MEKFKLFILNDHIFFGMLLLGIGIGSFLLGRVSVLPTSPAVASVVVHDALPALETKAVEEIIEEKLVTEEEKPKPVSSADRFVASKSGTKYHLLTCPGAKQIKEENKIYFSSKTEAESSGYKPAANCPGLD